MGDRGIEKPITMEDLDKMPLLHSCVRETLRMRPPIMQMMRKVRKGFTVKLRDGTSYDIPAGNQVCVSPSVNGRNGDEWDEPLKFKPDRFVGPDGKITDPQTAPHLEKVEKDGSKFKKFPF